MSMPIYRFICVAAAIFTMTIPATAKAQAPTTVVEYYVNGSSIYFITGRQSEQSLLDSLPARFQRTGMSFQADGGGSAPPLETICRYAATVAPTNFVTHFYGLPTDCAAIEAARLANFTNEGLDFAVRKPDATGACPTEAPVAVYRAFRKVTPVDIGNHRYSVSRSSHDTMVRRGWADEGVVFCVRSAIDETPPPTFPSAGQFANKCAAPRTGSSPFTGRPYPDTPGAFDDERSFLRSFTSDTYLWYREVNYSNPINAGPPTSYFEDLKTFSKANSLDSRGQPIDKDQFHFSQDTESFERNQSGTTSGYGIRWTLLSARPPRRAVAIVIDPESPAAIAGVMRGDEIVSIDGTDFVNGNNVDAINSGFRPRTAGETHLFELRSATGIVKSLALTSAELPSKSVSDVSVITTPTGRVGYVAFHSFGSFVSEAQLISAFSALAPQNVADLVLDLRYNGGGLLDVSAQLAFMIAGPARTVGKAYEKTRTNDKKPFGPDDVTPFYARTRGFSVAAGQPLPTLNLNRVYILTSEDTCSASEALINGLRGVDVDVRLVGTTTCGKPYGFFPTGNCGTTYFTIQFDGVNEKGDGDYVTGFPATCPASDDFSKALGDPSEKQLAAALALRRTGTCAASTAAQNKVASRKRAPFSADAVSSPNDFAFQSKLMKVRPPLFGLVNAVVPAQVRRYEYTE